MLKTIAGAILVGKYLVVKNQLKADNRPILHIRDRKVRGNLPAKFMAIHKPTFTYISSLYPTDKPNTYTLDFQGIVYGLEFMGDTATIKQIAKGASA